MSHRRHEKKAFLVSPELLAGNRRAVARAISDVERGYVEPGEAASALAPNLGRAHVLGITGAPGAGKSTLVHALLGEMLKQGQRVAVVAVDPSSPISGGALLGDRVRMGEHGDHPDAFIRSVASRGQLGGLSSSTQAIVDVFDAAGFDTVIVETVGAGQSEVEIMRVADTRIVACPPGLGDEVQAMKAGILEIADLLVVTKSDLPGAAATAKDLGDMLKLRRHPSAGGWVVPVLPSCANTGDGIPALVEAINAHRDACGNAKRLATRPVPGDSAAGDAGTRVMQLAQNDLFAQWMGITCTKAGAGHATARLLLASQHLNFNGSCHGGVLFALADTAFGLAANSHGKIAAGIDAHITYQCAPRCGDALEARAVEVSRSRKLAVYRVDLARCSDNAAICSFTGTVYITGLNHDSNTDAS